MSRDYYFLRMRKIVKKVVLNYNTCNKAKLVYYILYRLLKLPVVAKEAWKLVVIDFIVKLLPSREPITNIEYNAI